MINLDKAVIARYERDEHNFEILVEPELAQERKSGNEVRIDNLVASTDVYSDSAKGKRANNEDLNKVFGTTDFEKILDYILQHGEVQITTDQKRKMQESKKKKIIALIARNAVDPTTHLPHPLNRIEAAFENAKLHVDPFKSPEDQMEAALKALKTILPIKIETDRIEVIIPAKYAPKIYGALKRYKMTKEQWLNDGSFSGIFEIPAGLQTEFFDFVNKLTSGDVSTKIIERL